MNQRVLYLFVILIIIEQVVYIRTEEDNFSVSRDRRDALWKTTQVLNCIRRLRKVIIGPSKLDIGTEMLNCLQQVKTPKSNKKDKKT